MVTALTSDDRSVLQHVARYRLTTPEILAPTALLADTETSTAQRALELLARDEWLFANPLIAESADPGHICYQLTPRSAEALGQDAELAAPLSRDARIEAFAIATFCCRGAVFRQLFTKEEFQQKFRHLWFPGQPVRYYLEPVAPAATRLAFLKVDKAGPGRWDRLIDSCARFLRQRTDAEHVAAEHRPHVAAFQQLVEQRQFQFTVLTALPEKQRAIELELELRSAAGEESPPIQVHVVPGLLELLFPPGAVRSAASMNAPE